MALESSIFPSLLSCASGAVESVASRTQDALGRKRDRRYLRDELRHDKLYAPLVVLFIRNRIESCTSTRRSSWRERWNDFRAYSRQADVWRAFRACFSRFASESFGMECGYFPQAEIEQIICDNVALADERLIALLSCAQASRCDEYRSEDLTRAEYELARHVFAQHARLNRKIMG